jgi:NADH dehydrogenase [ubiquinone] 1 alpha subcomplex assembly factor 7
LRANIELRGPISVATFMREALTNPLNGYYVTQEAFGTAGDFITSPEISQMFGELIGLWCCDMWEKLGKPPHWNLVELGPGRGSLLQDMLRVLRKVPPMYQGMDIHLVEVSPLLRRKQATRLGCDANALARMEEQIAQKYQQSVIQAGFPLTNRPFQEK